MYLRKLTTISLLMLTSIVAFGQDKTETKPKALATCPTALTGKQYSNELQTLSLRFREECLITLTRQEVLLKEVEQSRTELLKITTNTKVSSAALLNGQSKYIRAHSSALLESTALFHQAQPVILQHIDEQVARAKNNPGMIRKVLNHLSGANARRWKAETGYQEWYRKAMESINTDRHIDESLLNLSREQFKARMAAEIEQFRALDAELDRMRSMGPGIVKQ